MRLHRAASVRLRKRRDQARKEFLNNRRSGDFGYRTASGVVDDGWDFQSFVHSQAPASLSVAADRGGIFSDTEVDPCKCSGPGRKHRQNRPSRRPRSGISEAGVKYKDFGFIDQHVGNFHREENRVEPVYEYPVARAAHQRQSQVLRQANHQSQHNNNQHRQEVSNQLLSLPVTISDYALRRDQVHLQKGLLWLKRDKFFSKWRERFFVVTPTHLKCFESDSESILLWKMEHCEIMNVVLSDKKGYLTLNVTFNKEGKIMLRSSAGINIWHSLLQNLADSSIQQQSTKDFWSGKNHSGGGDIYNVDSWLLDRQVPDSKMPTPKRSHRYQHVPDPYHHHQHQFQSLHNVWPELEAQPPPISRKPQQRQSHRRMRPKSCIELTDNNQKIYRNQVLRHEDSGNSSMSTSTPRSTRK